MSEPQSISTGIAARYATALFELAKDDKGLDALEADTDGLGAALSDSEDLSAFISSPVYSREEQENAIAAVAEAMKLGPMVVNTLRLMAQKRRLFVLPALVAELRGLIAAEKGEVTADVASATALTDAQKDKLAETLKASIGKDVKLNLAVDESLIGGLVVKVGSQMIDTSIRSKLAALQNTMKEVG
ncbi:MAG: F0F1 ATP synthase subunit delta [Paracoccaceae bacterium]|nr:F0F1 ATP synthase subunit delta [Paracoccaceae bacterium]